MKTTSILAATLLTWLSLADSHAQSPREQFKTAVAAFQKNATEDTARKLAELYKQLDPPPAVPEDAEFRALKGAAFVKQAGDAAAFAKAAVEFQAAIAAAPWVGEYHYNLAVCEKSAGRFSAAQTALKFARILARDDKERRDNLALRADLEAAQELGVAKQAAEEKAAAAKVAADKQAAIAAQEKAERQRPSVEGKWAESIVEFEIIRNGEKFSIIPGKYFGRLGRWSATDVKVDKSQVRFTLYQPSLPNNPVRYDLSLSSTGNELTGTFVSDDTYPTKFSKTP